MQPQELKLNALKSAVSDMDAAVADLRSAIGNAGAAMEALILLPIIKSVCEARGGVSAMILAMESDARSVT